MRSRLRLHPLPLPEVRGALINTIPVGVLGGVTTLLYGMIGMLGVRIWVENHVDFSSNVNLSVAAVTMVIGIADFSFAINGIGFNGIAIGSVLCLVVYHLMAGLGRLTGTVLPEEAKPLEANSQGAGVGDAAAAVETQEKVAAAKATKA